MLQFICVDMYFITDYGVFCGINAGLFKRNRIVYRPQHCGRWNHPTQVSSLQKGEECSDGGDSSALLGQTLLCSGIVFALESEVPGLNLGAGTDSALGTSPQLRNDLSNVLYTIHLDISILITLLLLPALFQVTKWSVVFWQHLPLARVTNVWSMSLCPSPTRVRRISLRGPRITRVGQQETCSCCHSDASLSLTTGCVMS